jgi:hypothetical protein
LLADRRAVEKLDPKADATVVDGGKEVKLFLQNRVEELAKSLVEEAGKSKKRKWATLINRTAQNMKTEKHDPLGQEFLRRQAEIVRQRDEFKPGPLTDGCGKDALTKDTENLPAFDPSKVSLGPNANVPRIKRQDLPSLEVIRELFEELANDLEVSKADYATLSLDDYFAPQKAADSTGYRRND